MGGNQWDARSASHILALKKPLSSVLVPEVRIELTTPRSSGESSTTELFRPFFALAYARATKG